MTPAIDPMSREVYGFGGGSAIPLSFSTGLRSIERGCCSCNFRTLIYFRSLALANPILFASAIVMVLNLI